MLKNLARLFVTGVVSMTLSLLAVTVGTATLVTGVALTSKSAEAADPHRRNCSPIWDTSRCKGQK